MVNPGEFHGKRKEFLLAEQDGYAQAMKEDRAMEQLADIMCRFLNKLERVDDAAPDIEQPVPDESALSAEEYQYSKMHKLLAKDSGKENPFTVLLHRLAGLSISKPRKPQAFALWVKANAAQVQEAWDQELKKKDIPAGRQAVKLNVFKGKLFKKESDEVQQQWAAMAEEEHDDVMKEYSGKIESPVSKEPTDVQRIIQPFIEMLMEVTGCVVTCIVAGPQPADRGHLHVVSSLNIPIIESTWFLCSENFSKNATGMSIVTKYPDFGEYQPPSSAVHSNPLNELKGDSNPSTLMSRGAGASSGDQSCQDNTGREKTSHSISGSDEPNAGPSKKHKKRVDAECPCPKKQVKTNSNKPTREALKINKRNKRTSPNSKTVSRQSDKSQSGNSKARAKTVLVTALRLPDKAPKWAVEALGTFQQEGVLPQFSQLVNLWVQFKIQEQFAGSSKFGTLQHPQAIHNWIAQGHASTFHLQAVPKGVDPVKEFEDKFWAWWASLQPEGHPRDDILLETDEDGQPSRVFEGDWESMQLAGVNGWSSVIPTLCFWSWRIKEMKTERYRAMAATE
ncbi:hypothetical protein ARMGADRAFT_1038007 [Armillaria gallica]|uniref:Uncharacterized protein n=1 Tax=Armillaria gallica TaxID=47427 RepID=A0A2H3CVI4_ARMGA|nr:hypothetical protein ARMGADRAFT_1038007 [Armillaria gallica]